MSLSFLDQRSQVRALNLNFGLASGRPAHWLMEGNQWLIIVVVGGLDILLVRDSLRNPLLAVVSHLDYGLTR